MLRKLNKIVVRFMGMGSSWCIHFCVLYFLVILLLNATHCFSFVQTQTLCHDDERSALLQFKQSFTIDKSASGDPSAYPKVASWSRQEGDHERSNCCSWDGVKCDEGSGHVIGLDLHSSCLYGSINSTTTLFQLVHLQRLDLSDNDFNGSEIPSRLGHDLTSLTYLNLSVSAFSGQIPSEISKLFELSTLDLSFNSDVNLTEANLRSLVQNLTNIKQLHLSQVSIPSTIPDMLVNASSLTSLRLEGCFFHGEFPVGIFHMPNIEVLDLMNNIGLTGYFPDDFNKSSPLKELLLSWTKFSGHIPASIGNLHSLNLLDISYCNFYPHFPSSLGNLTQLSYLDLSFFFDSNHNYFNDSTNINIFSGQVSWVGKLAKLYHLGLGFTNLSGPIPYFVANLTQLAELDLGFNQISSPLPSWLMKQTQLTLLSLRSNNLKGAIPRSLFHLQNLEYLDLSENNLSGLVEFEEFSKLQNLWLLRLSSNKLSLHITTNFSPTAPQFEVLELGSCNLTELPQFLKDQYKLVFLVLYDNQIRGQIPKWMWNATRETLGYLNLAHNFLTGFEQNPGTLPWPSLRILDLGFNMFQGSLPIPPTSVSIYSVPNNEYTGEIPASFCNLTDLLLLDLSNNKLSGMLPQCFGNFSVLAILKLQNNSFQGDIPHMCPNTESYLEMVDLSYNQFQGKLPRSMANCTDLEFLNVGNNQMSDIFPSWLGALPVLRVLILRSNGFHGIIGKPTTNHEFLHLCIIDLSNNGFSSVLPSNYFAKWNCMKSVGSKQKYAKLRISFGTRKCHEFLDIDYPMTIFGKGIELKYWKTPYLLRFIDLSSNRFEGEIPARTIGNLRGLHFLDLSNNTLTGLIPSSLENLTLLESLDLSQNQLSGNIPSTLAQLNFLAYLNVSHNHLWGPIPHGQQFDIFLEDSFQGNLGLCGKPLPKKCEDSEPPAPSKFEEDEDSGFQIEFDWYVVLPGVVSGLVVGVVTGNIFATKNHAWFVKTFSRRRQPRGTRVRRGHRT